jgi:hypothetical protein
MSIFSTFGTEISVAKKGEVKKLSRDLEKIGMWNAHGKATHQNDLRLKINL